jgi:DNA-binding response OmpR family regulator
MSGNEGAGCRVLVVEDDMLIAVAIEEVLHALNCQVVGPAASLEKALKLAQGESFDVAILDVTIRGGKVHPVAELLLARGIPFVFASGYGDWALPEALRDQPRLMKPFTVTELEEQIKLLCSAAKAAQRLVSRDAKA